MNGGCAAFPWAIAEHSPLPDQQDRLSFVPTEIKLVVVKHNINKTKQGINNEASMASIIYLEGRVQASDLFR